MEGCDGGGLNLEQMPTFASHEARYVLGRGTFDLEFSQSEFQISQKETGET